MGKRRRRQTNQRRWQQGHQGKRVYRSRSRAWLMILRIWARERRLDSLTPYVCYYTDRLEDRKTGDPHIHIGHTRWTRSRRLRRRARRMFLYPFFRARRQVKVRASTAAKHCAYLFTKAIREGKIVSIRKTTYARRTTRSPR